MAKNIKIEIEAKNLGPHRDLRYKGEVSSLDLGLFASNGSGKTFISRAFRLLNTETLNIEETNKLLTLGQDKAQFNILIKNKSESNPRDLKIIINKNQKPTIANNTSYTFHVFNRDYVKENLEELKYKPNGKIEGYILGKEKIDLTKEKEEVEKLKKAKIKKVEIINEWISKGKLELDKLKIRKNISEYISINIDNILNDDFVYQESETIKKLVEKHNKLKEFPDDFSDLNNNIPFRPAAFSEKLKVYLATKYTRSHIAEDFKGKVKTKQRFIEDGLSLIKNDSASCPFCEQILGQDALNLIDQYLEYLADEESKKIKEADVLIGQLRQLEDEIKGVNYNILKLKNEYDKIKIYLPSIEETELDYPNDPLEIQKEFQILSSFLDTKKQDITMTFTETEIDICIKTIGEWINDYNRCVEKNERLINQLNVKKRNINSEKLNLNKRICSAKYNHIKAETMDLTKEIKDLETKIQKLNDDIRTKEQSHKMLKKDKIIESFRFFLTQFFGLKYTFDEDKFCLKFLDHSLEENASDVLSDGEKSIVAFCFYLAETHKLINKETDYQQLFFVIDDPISSLDFHYVYSVSQAIRSLNQYFPLSRIRFLILTHNLEFMSILIRNNIISNRFYMADGIIKELNRNLIMPYEEHLRDIYKVSSAEIEPSHTTPNSIRHVLETINRFISPNVEFKPFCEGIDSFQENAFLYSLIHDNSHGGLRSHIPYTQEMIKSGCELVINYVKKSFAGQLELLDQQSN